jgi:electron transfer flavoprotein beta subunit
MYIVCPIKQVPQTQAVKMDPETGTMIREGVEPIINPLDLYAVEMSLRLREQHGGAVTVISMGPPQAIMALREAVAMGCDQAVLVSDQKFAGADTWATAYVLAAAIRKLGQPDLILCGERATDGDTGQVGPGLASFLDLPVVTYVSRIDGLGQGRCRVHRLVEEGYEVLEMALPGVLTVVKEVAEPRMPTLRGKQRAKRVEIPTWGQAELNVEAHAVGLNGSPTRVVRIFRPTVARECDKHFATDEKTTHQAADKLLAVLRRNALLFPEGGL